MCTQWDQHLKTKIGNNIIEQKTVITFLGLCTDSV